MWYVLFRCKLLAPFLRLPLSSMFHPHADAAKRRTQCRLAPVSRSADCWALGVLTFEFTAGFTPFQQPGEPSDMTALFTRIASSKVATSNTLFPADYDQKARSMREKLRN